VPLARDLHPEFGYVGSAPRLFRKVGLVLAFLVIGVIAGVSGVAVFVAGPDPDPMSAMALAPADALIGATKATLAATAEMGGPQVASGQKGNKGEAFNKTGAIKAPCPENVSEQPGDCTVVRASKPRPVQAVNERPAIAAVAIGRREGPAILPSQEPAISVAATPQLPDSSASAADSAEPVNAAPAAAVNESPAPAPAAKKPRARTRHVQQRDEHARPRSYSHDFQSGYARLW
jgi:hypothetical protein